MIGTGKLHTLRELCETAYYSIGRDWQDSVVSDLALIRPVESGKTLANPAKAKHQLAWEPTVSFEEMVDRMVEAQVQRLKHLIH